VLLLVQTGDKSYIRKGPDYEYGNWNISVVVCDIDTL